MERRSKYGFLLLVFLIAGLVLYGILYEVYDGGKALVPADLQTTARGLTASFEGNEGLADSLYLYKVVSVSGVFQQLIDDGPGRFIVRLSGEPNGKAMVDCHMDSMYTRDDLLLRTGDSVTIRGTCAGRWPNILLLQCIIEK
jgi:hypothetical protein